MAIVTVEKLTQAFSLALEDRAKSYADLVSNSNIILNVMKENEGFAPFSGPTIRERILYNQTGSYTRYAGFQFLNPKPAELFNDAEFTVRMGATSVTLSMEQVLLNSGRNQLIDVMEASLKGSENELIDRFVEDLHGDGTLSNQITGIKAIVPTTPTNVIGGIDRALVPDWRTGSYNATADFGAAVTASNIHEYYTRVLINHSRGRKGPSIICADTNHFMAFQKATMAIQRVTKEGKKATLGFRALAFAGAGYELDVVLEGGIGSAMPANTTYFLKLGDDGIKFRYHPERNFESLGKPQRPINQDALVQHIGFMGNLTIANPLWQAKLYN